MQICILIYSENQFIVVCLQLFKFIITAVKKVSSILQTFITKQYQLDNPGMHDYFEEKGGKFLDGISKNTCCFIKRDSADTEEWINARKVQVK